MAGALTHMLPPSSQLKMKETKIAEIKEEKEAAVENQTFWQEIVEHNTKSDQRRMDKYKQLIAVLKAASTMNVIDPFKIVPYKMLGELPQAAVDRIREWVRATCLAGVPAADRDFECELRTMTEVSKLNAMLSGVDNENGEPTRDVDYKPLKVVNGEYVINAEDPKHVELVEKYNEEIAHDIARERLFLERLNGSGMYAELIVFDEQTGERMDASDIGTRLVEVIKKQNETTSARIAELEAQVAELKGTAKPRASAGAGGSRGSRARRA